MVIFCIMVPSTAFGRGGGREKSEAYRETVIEKNRESQLSKTNTVKLNIAKITSAQIEIDDLYKKNETILLSLQDDPQKKELVTIELDRLTMELGKNTYFHICDNRMLKYIATISLLKKMNRKTELLESSNDLIQMISENKSDDLIAIWTYTVYQVSTFYNNDIEWITFLKKYSHIANERFKSDIFNQYFLSSFIKDILNNNSSLFTSLYIATMESQNYKTRLDKLYSILLENKMYNDLATVLCVFSPLYDNNIDAYSKTALESLLNMRNSNYTMLNKKLKTLDHGEYELAVQLLCELNSHLDCM